MAALGVVPASRVAMDTSSLLIAFGPLLTFKAPAPKLIISDEFNSSSRKRYSYFRIYASKYYLCKNLGCLYNGTSITASFKAGKRNGTYGTIFL